MKIAVCCRDGCHLVAGFVAGDFPVWIRKSLYLRDILIFIIISGNESNEIFQEN